MVGGVTSGSFDPPLVDILVETSSVGQQRVVDLIAEVTPANCRVTFNFIIDFPVEELVIDAIVAVDKAQVIGQLLRRVEVVDVDVGMRRCQLAVIRFSVNDRHRPGSEHPEESFTDEIGAERLLQRQDEFVITLDDFVALVDAAAVQRAALAVNVHLDVFG